VAVHGQQHGFDIIEQLRGTAQTRFRNWCIG
jgi:hypothetical protein